MPWVIKSFVRHPGGLNILPPPQDLYPRSPLMHTLLSYLSAALSRMTPSRRTRESVIRFVHEALSRVTVHFAHHCYHILSSGYQSDSSTLSWASSSEDSDFHSVRL